MTQTLTASLVSFTRGLRYEAITPLGVQRVRAAIVDCAGCMLAGSVDETVRILSAWVTEEEAGAPGRATAVGLGFRVSAGAAALINGTSGHALDYDDVSPPMIGHASVPLVPALLAAAEISGASGSDLIVAYVIGLDVEARLGRLMNPAHYAHGWHSTSTLGALAAACGAARLLDLDATRTAYAIGIAASGAAGLRKNFGSMVKPLHAGQAAQRGLLSALLASKGFDADPDILDGMNGFLDVFRGGDAMPDAHSIRFGVDQTLEIAQSGVGLKQYATCGVTHTALDAALGLQRAHGFTVAEIERVDCGVSALAPEVLIYRHARNGLQGKFCMAYSVAVALLDGMAGPAQFTDERVMRQDVQALQQRVHMTIESGLVVHDGVFPARLTVHLRDGTSFTASAAKAHGMHPSLPLTEAEIDAKFRQCAAFALDASDTDRALNLLNTLERLPDLHALMSVLRGKGKSARR